MESEFQILSNKIDALTQLFHDLLKPASSSKSIARSEKIDELATSLSQAQLEYKPITDLKINTYTAVAFASLQQVVDSTRPSLGKYGLSVLQDIFDHEDGSQVLHTVLLHNGGQYVESQMRVKPNGNEPASITSYINWLKRTAYSSLVGCPIPKEDDDGEAYQSKLRTLPARGSAALKKDLSYETISKTQLEDLEYELEGFPDTAEEILKAYELQNMADLPQEKYRTVVTRVREIKKQLLKG